MSPCDPAVTMREFAHAKVRELLDTVILEIQAAAADPNADAVHDMRVSIRRMQQGLRLFRQYLPGGAVRRVRKQMKRVMEHAGELRNFDIAIELARDAGQQIPDLSERRASAKEALSAVLTEVSTPGIAVAWRRALKLEGT